MSKGGERGLGIRTGQYKQGWEASDFPIVCETCLGENPYVKMLKYPYGKECKICARPFTVFRWRAGKGRFKKTEVCQTCAKLKNVCQTCVFDLKYGLPVQVRDQMLENGGVNVPKIAENRDYWAQQMNQNLEQLQLPYDKMEAPSEEALEKFARRGPQYKRNQAKVCSFFVKGTCTRGEECPYRHELPQEGPLSEQNLKDRFHGTNDPLAERILGRMGQAAKRRLPKDQSIRTLMVQAVNEKVTEERLGETMRVFGALTGVQIVPGKKIAFVEFAERSGAEAAWSAVEAGVVIDEQRFDVVWAKRNSSDEGKGRPISSEYRGDSDDEEEEKVQARPAPPLAPPPGVSMTPSDDARLLASLLKDSATLQYLSLIHI
eukprot:TRINITY_DN4376_c0_g1_i4.p1 TRINITY_DN4376_c0_g1~~TRINITY_DN4376_c0_g1_i4.p1  ORF type:complete len:375 (+),score=82.57 TRINITY_DN4376_c0_g1_i4:115-1239(+)